MTVLDAELEVYAMQGHAGVSAFKIAGIHP